ncbi:MAG: oligosaccharide flippase family protein [Alphaproteobacteria bacterium]
MLEQYLRVVGLRLIGLLAAAAFLLIVSAAVPVEVFGRYSLVFSILQVVGAALLAWPNQALLRFGREEFVAHASIKSTLGNRLALHGVMLALVLPLAALAAPWLAAWTGIPTPPLRAALLLGLLLIPLSDLANFAALATNNLVGYGLVPLVLRLSQLGSVLLILAFVAPTWPLLIAGTLLGYALGAIIGFARIPRRAIAGLRPTLRGAGRLLAYSWPIPFAGLSAALINWMDLWFLRHFLAVGDVGVYAWAYHVVFLATALLVPLSAVLAPRAVDSEVATDAAAKLGLMNICFATTAIAAAILPLILMMLFLGASALPLGAYAGAIQPLLLLATGTALQFAMAQIEPTLLARQAFVRGLVAALILTAAINALANWLFIPIWGTTGAALATILAYAGGLLAQVSLARRLTGNPLRPTWPLLLLVGANILLALAFARLPLAAVPLLAIIATTTGLAIGRATGLFSGLNTLSGQIRSLPAPLTSSADRLLHWLDSPRRGNAATSA